MRHPKSPESGVRTQWHGAWLYVYPAPVGPKQEQPITDEEVTAAAKRCLLVRGALLCEVVCQNAECGATSQARGAKACPACGCNKVKAAPTGAGPTLVTREALYQGFACQSKDCGHSGHQDVDSRKACPRCGGAVERTPLPEHGERFQFVPE